MKEEVFTIESLNDENLGPYCSCLEEWSKEMKEAGNIKCNWVETLKERGLDEKGNREGPASGSRR